MPMLMPLCLSASYRRSRLTVLFASSDSPPPTPPLSSSRLVSSRAIRNYSCRRRLQRNECHLEKESGTLEGCDLFSRSLSHPSIYHSLYLSLSTLLLRSTHLPTRTDLLSCSTPWCWCYHTSCINCLILSRPHSVCLSASPSPRSSLSLHSNVARLGDRCTRHSISTSPGSCRLGVLSAVLHASFVVGASCHRAREPFLTRERACSESDHVPPLLFCKTCSRIVGEVHVDPIAAFIDVRS